MGKECIQGLEHIKNSVNITSLPSCWNMQSIETLELSITNDAETAVLHYIAKL